MPDKITRAMVPVLLCFDVHHEENATEQEIAERARAIVVHNLGDIGDETGQGDITFEDEDGNCLDASIYPSDLDWCDTMAHAKPDTESADASRQVVALSWAMQTAYSHAAEYLEDGNPAVDYGEEWPEIASERALHMRDLAGMMHTEVEINRWNDLADRYEAASKV